MRIHEPEAKPSRSRRQVLVAEDLQKSYGPRQALRGLSFSLKAGHILGFLGPNGAGKTTAIRILTTILEPSSGRFLVDGIGSDDPDRIRRRIGVLPESLGFSKHMTGAEFVTYFGRLYGLTKRDAKAKGRALLKDVGLEQRARSLVGSYSRGMRQRLGIARALINDPAVVFLDEPTLGLDPRGQQELLGLVRWIAGERKAGVVLCSHHLAEVEGVCDDVVILSHGQVVAQGPVAEVIGGSERNVIRLRVPSASMARAQEILTGIPAVAGVIQTGGSVSWLCVELMNSGADEAARDGRHVNNRILDSLIRAEIPILGFEGGGGSRLQDVFLQLTEGGIE